MVDTLKKNILVVIVLVVTLILGILAIVTAIRIRTTQPVAPTVPQKKPQAAENLCTLDFEIGAPAPVAGKCAAHDGVLNYTQLITIDGKPGKGVNAGLFQLPLSKPFTFSLTVKNNGTTSFTATYKANLNKCLPEDLINNPHKCTGPSVSDFSGFPTYLSQTKTLAAGETQIFTFSSNAIECNQRYQYDIFIPDVLTQDGACGPDISGLVEFTCVTPTPTPSPTITPSPTPTHTPTPTLTPTPIPQCNDSCSSNAQCPASLVCSSGRCRNPQCTGESSCNCPNPTATPTPTPPPSCNSSCSDNAGCPSSMICSSGVCRNPICTAQSTCVCPGPTNTPKPTTPQELTKGGQPVAPKTPEAGNLFPTAILILAGGAILLLGAIL